MTEAFLNQLGLQIQTDHSVPWMLTLVDASLIGAAIVVAGLVFEKLMRRRLSSKFLYCLWMLVLVRFVLVWAPESPTSFLNSIQPATDTKHVIVAAEPIATPVFTIAESSIVSASTTTISQSANTLAQVQSTPAVAPLTIDWLLFAMAVWLSGCIFLFTKLLVSWRNLRHTVSLANEANLIEPDLAEICDEQVQVLKLRHRVRLLVSNRLSTPATTGIFRPTILIPQRCIDELNADQLRLVLSHELTHVKRHDGLLQLLAWTVQTIHWFNPLARFATSKLAAHRELSCDQAVLESLGGKLRKLYGETILQLAEFEMVDQQHSPALAHQFIGPNNNLITQRIDMIIKPGKSSWLAKAFAVALVMATLAVGYTEAQSPTPDKPQEAEGSEDSDESNRNPVDATADATKKIYARNNAWPKPFPSPAKQLYAVQPDSEKEIVGGHAYPVNGKESQAEDWSTVKATALSKAIRSVAPARYPESQPKAPDMIMPSRIRIDMTVQSDRRLKFSKKIPTIVVDRQELLEVTPTRPNELLFKPINAGIVRVSLSFEDQTTESIEISIRPVITEEIRKKLKSYFPATKFKISITDELGIHLHLHESNVRIAKNMITVIEDLTEAKVTASYERKTEIQFKLKQYEVDTGKLKTSEFKNLAKLLQAKDSKLAIKPDAVTIGAFSDEPKLISDLVSQNLIQLTSQSTQASSFGTTVDFFSGSETLSRKIDGDFAVDRVGDSLELTAMHENDDQLVLETRVQFSRIGRPSLLRRVNMGRKMKFGETMFFLFLPGQEKMKGSLILVSPQKVATD